jgi:hypothetical protein
MIAFIRKLRRLCFPLPEGKARERAQKNGRLAPGGFPQRGKYGHPTRALYMIVVDSSTVESKLRA